MTEKRMNYRTSLFCLVTSLYWFSLYAYVPTLPGYADSLGASHRMVGLILGSYGFTQMLLRIPLGIYSDTINRRKPFVVAGLAIALVSALGMRLFPSPGMLLVFRGLTGVAAAAWVTYAVLFSSYFPSESATRAIGYISAFNAMGQMAAMMLGGLAAHGFGRAAPFTVAAVGGAVGLMLSMGVVEKKVDREPGRLSEFASVGSDRGLILVSSLAVLVQLITFATVYGFTPIAAERIGAGDFELGLLTTLSTLPRILAAALSGALFARIYGERRTVIWAFVVLSISCMAIPLVPSLPLLYVSQIIGGFAAGLIFPLLMGLSIKAVAEGKRASAMGFFQAIYGIGMFVGPVFVGVVSDTLSLQWGFWLAGLVGLTGALTTLYLWDRSFASLHASRS